MKKYKGGVNVHSYIISFVHFYVDINIKKWMIKEDKYAEA